ncbi:hypothetical protein DFJ63DRAFT_54425 [Scheffersomyces coipomensis]|uniref:uncharacterized protein n=1 Tax=Scheffersomyces coipomensis TaxID=1788519 RepID=UPI00315CDC76
MIRRRQILPNAYASTKRFVTNESNKKGSKRFMQTLPIAGNGTGMKNGFYSGLNHSIAQQQSNSTTNIDSASTILSKWSSHKLTFPTDQSNTTTQSNNHSTTTPIRRSRNSRFAAKTVSEPLDTLSSSSSPFSSSPASFPSGTTIIDIETPKMEFPTTPTTTPTTSASSTTTTTSTTAPKKKRTLRPRKALITLSKGAVDHLRALVNQPNPKMIRVGVRNRGCSGLTYHLEYVEEAGKFDELVEQDGVKVLIDSKALFSIVGSEMDWLDDKLSSRFIFKNPNSKGSCGCGESFMV